MKNKISILFLIGSMLFFSSCTNGQSSIDTVNAAKIAMLKSFYTEYITEFSIGDPKKAGLIQKKYTTSGLRHKWDSLQIDYDPYLKGQDSDTSFIKTLQITKDLTKPNVYIVTYLDNVPSKATIYLKIVCDSTGYKIDDVW